MKRRTSERHSLIHYCTCLLSTCCSIKCNYWSDIFMRLFSVGAFRCCAVLMWFAVQSLLVNMSQAFLLLLQLIQTAHTLHASRSIAFSPVPGRLAYAAYAYTTNICWRSADRSRVCPSADLLLFAKRAPSRLFLPLSFARA